MRWLMMWGLIVCTLAVPAAAETFDNASVIALTRAGLRADIIAAKVGALPCSYDLSTSALLALREAGVAPAVMVAMVQKCSGSARAQGLDNATADPSARHAPGIYLAGAAALTPLRPAASVGIKHTGNGSLLFPFKATLTVAQAHAQVTTGQARPTFYFYFDPADTKTSTFGTAASEAAQSPNEFSLVRFRTDRNTRQLAIGRVQPYTDVSGIDPKIALPFTIEDRGDGGYRVTFAADLVPGEYGFVLIGEGLRNTIYYRIFDFAVASATPGR